MISTARERRGALLALIVLAPASLLLALCSGSVTLQWGEILRALGSDGSDTARTIVLELRLPRTLNGFATGGLLALSGALMQVLVRNPLADPYVLGISGGAAVAALSTVLLGLSGLWLQLGALVGALASMLLVLGTARAAAQWDGARLLLTGVVLAAGWGAVIALLLAVSPSASLPVMLSWLLGDLGRGVTPWPGLLALSVGLVLARIGARDLNALALGELQARALGVPLAPVRYSLYVLASLLTATAVTIAGTIGFVGLVVPHLLRLLGGSDHRWLLPAAVLLGGSLLVLADTFARTVLAPRQLPVGAITALMGVPLFLFLLRRSR